MQILFLGPPGSGKGTQAIKLAKKLNLPHFSSGDLLRQAIVEHTQVGIKAKQFMDEGKLVPDPILLDMFEEKLSASQCQKGFILDGFPRNIAQAESLDVLLAKLKLPMTWVINLEVEDSVLKERMAGRRVCSSKDCGAVYHLKFSPPSKAGICDRCGSQLIQRSDDHPEVFGKRLEEYNQKTLPLIEYYTNKHVLVTIAANGNPDDIFLAILQAIKVQVTN